MDIEIQVWQSLSYNERVLIIWIISIKDGSLCYEGFPKVNRNMYCGLIVENGDADSMSLKKCHLNFPNLVQPYYIVALIWLQIVLSQDCTFIRFFFSEQVLNNSLAFSCSLAICIYYTLNTPRILIIFPSKFIRYFIKERNVRALFHSKPSNGETDHV